LVFSLYTPRFSYLRFWLCRRSPSTLFITARLFFRQSDYASLFFQPELHSKILLLLFWCGLSCSKSGWNPARPSAWPFVSVCVSLITTATASSACYYCLKFAETLGSVVHRLSFGPARGLFPDCHAIFMRGFYIKVKLLRQGIRLIGRYQICVYLWWWVDLDNFIFVPFSYYSHSKSFTAFVWFPLVSWIDSPLSVFVLVVADDVLSVYWLTTLLYRYFVMLAAGSLSCRVYSIFIIITICHMMNYTTPNIFLIKVVG
jgi:hypothetical protein